MIVENTWVSIVKACQDLIENIDGEVVFHDWETHSDTQELPNGDLLGPTAIAIEEYSSQMIKVTFAIAFSSYGDDPNLFRHRAMAAKVFERLRPEKKLAFYDANTGEEIGYLFITEGTTLAPMSRAETRPFQFVSAEALLDPRSAPVAG